MSALVNSDPVNDALDLREKVDKALSMGISAETIGAVLMMEKGLDPGVVNEPLPESLDSLLLTGNRS